MQTLCLCHDTLSNALTVLCAVDADTLNDTNLSAADRSVHGYSFDDGKGALLDILQGLELGASHNSAYYGYDIL